MARSHDAFTALVSDRIVGYHAAFARALGSVTAGLLLSQLLYWSDKGHDPQGWIYKTIADLEEETGMTYRQQQTARKCLVRAGVLEEERRGMPAQLYFRVNIEAVKALLVSFAESANQDSTKAQIKSEQKRTSSIDKSDKLLYGTETTDTETTHISANAENQHAEPEPQAAPQSVSPAESAEEIAPDGFEDWFPPDAAVSQRERVPDGVTPAEWLAEKVQRANQAMAARAGEEPWLHWHPSRVRARNGIARTDLQHVGWLVEQETGLVPTDRTMQGWLVALAEIYQAGRGNWAWIAAGIRSAWERESQYRPQHPRGLVNPVNKAAAEAQSGPPSPTYRGVNYIGP